MSSENSPLTNTTACPCGSGALFGDCCQPYISGVEKAPSAEKLMRSRYCAFTLQDADYLKLSWHDSTRPEEVSFEGEHLQWKGLKIVATEQGQPGDSEGKVSFEARFKSNGRAHVLKEVSNFVCEAGQWFYVDGEVSSNAMGSNNKRDKLAKRHAKQLTPSKKSRKKQAKQRR